MNWNEIYNRHKGETCLIIGNGPSLRNVPLAFLQNIRHLARTGFTCLMDSRQPIIAQ